MLRCLKRAKPIHTVKPANTLDGSGLIHGLIGLDVPQNSSCFDEEDIALFTTIHQAIALAHVTKPMQTQKIEKKVKKAG